MIKYANFQGIPGSVLHRIIEKIGAEDEFYNRINRMKVFIFQLAPFIHMYICKLPFFFFFPLQVVLDGTEKISSDELFTVLDEGSEKTAFSTDVCRCPEKVIFGLGMLLLCDLNNVLASCCYFVERNLVGLSFMYAKMYYIPLTLN